MAIDRLQEKIRKLKNPAVVNFSVLQDQIPSCVLEAAGSFLQAYKLFCKELLTGLKDVVPGVRFNFNSFAVRGGQWLDILDELLDYAKSQGYYVILDAPEALSAQDAQQSAGILLDGNCKWYFDGLVLTSYIGSDGIKPYVSQLKKTKKDLFVVVRTSNKTAPELQDLLSGSRLMHLANADIINRFAEDLVGRSGYSQVAMLAAASSADSLRSLRSKYKNMFLLLDGCDYPNANAKNCSYAFDTLGHGAAACAGLSITAAWKENQSQDQFVDYAVEAAQRLKKNLIRYITIL